jgi:hypothetical protein
MKLLSQTPVQIALLRQYVEAESQIEEDHLRYLSGLGKVQVALDKYEGTHDKPPKWSRNGAEAL